MASVPPNRTDSKLQRFVVPEVSDLTSKEAAYAYLDAGFWPIPWRAARREGKMDKIPCGEYGLKGWDYDTVQRETRKSIARWKSSWQVGLITSPRSGLLACDVDYPDEF